MRCGSPLAPRSVWPQHCRAMASRFCSRFCSIQLVCMELEETGQQYDDSMRPAAAPQLLSSMLLAECKTPGTMQTLSVTEDARLGV